MKKLNFLETQSLKILQNKKWTPFTKNLKNFFETFTIIILLSLIENLNIFIYCNTVHSNFNN